MLELLTGSLEMLEIDQNLDNLAQVLGAEPLDERTANLGEQEFVE